MSFVPLFCRSHFSPLGVASPADLVRRARALGYATLGICDEGTVAGFEAFETACREQGIRPIFGCRLTMEGLALAGMAFPVDFLIETEQGYRNLMRLLTRQLRGGNGERIPLAREEFAERTQGLVCVIPMDGELNELNRQRDRTRTEQFLERAGALFGAALAFGLRAETDEELDSARLALKLAGFMRVRALAAPTVYYPEPGDAAAAVFLRNPTKAPTRAFTPPEDLKSLPALWPESDVFERWHGLGEELPHEAGNIARRCTWRPNPSRRAFPAMDFERGFDPNSYLFDLVIKGATQRYGEITEALKQRIHREFEDVRAHNLALFVLLSHQLALALDQRGISRGMGRGRMVASVLAYCLGITRIDPMQYKLVSRSLAAEGEGYPPVHVEVPESAVAQVVQFLRETQGEKHIAEIGRLQDLRRDQMITELANWAGMTAEEKRLVHRERSRLRSAGAAQRLDELAEANRSRRWRDASFLGDIAARLAPRPRQWYGTGDRYVLSGEPLENMLPLVAAQQGRAVTGIEEDGIARMGMARIVFMPHQMLDILDKALQAARTQNPSLRYESIPLDDRATFDLISRGDTSGIPPLEGITIRALLIRATPRNLLQLLGVKTQHGAATSEHPRELSDELPDVLLSYQCAYLKANYPLAFYGAAIDAMIDRRENPSTLVREARIQGYQVLPPDINFSDWGTTLHSGNIRLGLSAVKGFGRKAWENVHEVRSGGSFTSLEAFCEQVDMRLIPSRLLRTLIGAGAMDGLDRSRQHLEEALNRMQHTLREQERQARRGIGQATLFELDEWEETSDPHDPPEEVVDPASANPWEKLRREVEALGFFLSIDPLDRHRIVNQHLAPRRVEQLTPRMVGKPLRIAGLVCQIERKSPLLHHEGDILVNLEGLLVRLPRVVAELSDFCLEDASEVLVIGRLIREDRIVCLQAEGIWRLADLEDQATKVSRVRLSLTGENKSTLKLLLELAREFPGNTELELTDYPERMGWTYRRLARLRLFFCSPLYQGLCKILPFKSVMLIDAAGQPLAAHTARTQMLESEPATEPSLGLIEEERGDAPAEQTVPDTEAAPAAEEPEPTAADAAAPMISAAEPPAQPEGDNAEEVHHL